MRLFGGATYFCHLSWRCDFFAIFWWCDIFVIFNFVWGFLSSFEATTFLPFSGISYFRGEKILGLSLRNSERKDEPGVKMGKFKQRIDAQQIIEF